MRTIVLTDHPWPDIDLERDLLEAAGLRLVSGPSAVAPVAEIDALVAREHPVGILTCWAQVSARAIAAAPDLRGIARLGVGLDNIDVAAATAAGVLVTNVPDYCFEEVSDHAVGMLLALARGLSVHDARVKQGAWLPGEAKLRRFSEYTVGLLGYGRIARCAAGKLSGFGVRLLAHTRSGTSDGVAEAVSLERLTTECDAIIIAAPLNDASRRLFDAGRIARMKRGALLVNVSRGAIVDNQALIAALDSGQIGGAGLDVIDGEPDPPRALVERSNVIATPHMAWISDTALEELRERACADLIAVVSGRAPVNPCNAPAPRAAAL